jgi:hypothetical protein
MQAFERDAHMYLRRSDLRSAEKRVHIQELLGKYGFAREKAETR